MIKLLILELLRQQVMSGYQMKQTLEQTDAKRWGGVLPGSIYNALNKLEKEGFVSIASIKMTGNRQTAFYEITEKGRGHQKALILQCLKEASISYNGALYSGIGFSSLLEPAQALEALENNIQQLQAEKDAIIKGKIHKEQALSAPVSALSAAVFEHMLQTIELQTTLIEKVSSIIAQENNAE